METELHSEEFALCKSHPVFCAVAFLKKVRVMLFHNAVSLSLLGTTEFVKLECFVVTDPSRIGIN